MKQTHHHDRAAERLLRIRDAADVLAVSERTIWLYFERGILEPVRIGRCTRVRRSDLDALMQRKEENDGAA